MSKDAVWRIGQLVLRVRDARGLSHEDIEWLLSKRAICLYFEATLRSMA